ncbi:AAA family ATPase [Pantoea sp. RSPAM1]|uniref:AAA family ATPase n=1 Tax=Pantoea sp. RSPAM1 TaxID=2675223 RepID=UPI00315CD04D
MRIISISAKNSHSNLIINKINFDSFTLLVGASGVGKTQILSVINNAKRISKGEGFSGFNWHLDFDIDGQQYSWSGEFESLKDFDDFSRFLYYVSDDDKPKPKLVSENLVVNGISLARRDKDNIFFKDKITVKLSPYESILSLLKAEPEIATVNSGFDHISTIDLEEGHYAIFGRDGDIDPDKDLTFDQIKELKNSLRAKLFLCQEKFPEHFSSIIETYKDIFPYIEGVKVQRYEDHTAPRAYASTFVIKVKERGIDSWISHVSMSSGMLKTLLQLSYLYLSPKGTVFLIDEFENGFGVNCINDITDILLTTGSGVQFIITSHHPYIINNIPIDKWKIISRKAGIISSFKSEDFKLNESNHEAFTKLINLDIYSEGADR